MRDFSFLEFAESGLGLADQWNGMVYYCPEFSLSLSLSLFVLHRRECSPQYQLSPRLVVGLFAIYMPISFEGVFYLVFQGYLIFWIKLLVSHDSS